MFPQSELDNYKLQVELLQEKLKRSEENRDKLQQQLEKTLHKRNEHDKQVRHKTHQKYQQFLDEQQKRNDRNKMLVQMLERIDQQTSAMAARSERLKMMKLQYEMYFAKLVQTQTMRCIQSSAPTVGGAQIPVLLPAGTMAPAFAVQEAAQAAPATPAAAAVPADNSAPTAVANFPLQNVASHVQPTACAMSPLTPRGWTLALATPTPAGMFLTSTPTAAAPSYDYLRQPIGYVPQMPQLEQLQLQTMKTIAPADTADTPLPTLAALNDANVMPAAAAKPMQTAQSSLTVSTTMPSNNLEFRGSGRPQTQSHQQQQQQLAQQLSTLSTTGPGTDAASVPLTFDKLPKDPLASFTFAPADSVDNNMAAVRAANATAAATIEAAARPPQLTTARWEDNFGNNFDGSSSSDKDKGVLPPMCMEREEQETAKVERDGLVEKQTTMQRKFSPDNESMGPAAAAADKKAISSFLAAAKERREFAETSPLQVTKSLHTPTEQLRFLNEEYDGSTGGKAAPESAAATHTQRATGGFAVEQTSTPKPAANVEGNQFLPAAPPKMSIENIENAIYGELVKPPTESDARNTLDARQELLQDFYEQTNNVKDVNSPLMLTEEANVGAPQPQESAYPVYATVAGEDTSVSSMSYNQEATESYEPTYATIDEANNATGAADYAQPTTESVSYSEDPNAAPQYASQYAAEGIAGSDTTQQDYAGMQYGNYDDTQYGAEAYDLNAYPGYTYDEATGQYTPDPNQQQYDPAAPYGYDQQQYEAAAQQQVEYDYTNYPQEAESTPLEPYVAAEAAAEPTTTTTTPNTEEPKTQDERAPAVSAAPVPAAPTAPASVAATAGADNEAITTPKVAKAPTSILSTHTASNDAQKKKKRVNFVDSSETDDSSSAKAAGAAAVDAVVASGAAGTEEPGGSESDFDFSTAAEQGGT